MDVQGVLLSINSNMDVQGVSLYTANRMDMQVVTIATARSVDVQCAWCMPFHCQQYGLAGCVPFYCQQYGRAGCTPFLNAGMSDFPASSHSGTGMNKSADAGNIPVPEKGAQSGMLRYHTQIQDAGMPMLMPSYACLQSTFLNARLRSFFFPMYFPFLTEHTCTC
jgi:hypothetical protein